MLFSFQFFGNNWQSFFVNGNKSLNIFRWNVEARCGFFPGFLQHFFETRYLYNKKSKNSNRHHLAVDRNKSTEALLHRNTVRHPIGGNELFDSALNTCGAFKQITRVWMEGYQMLG